MTLHRGDRVLFRGEIHIVKRVDDADPVGRVVIEDDEGFAFSVRVNEVTRPGYTATVDSDGWVRDIEDEEPEDSVDNREGDPAFNGAFNAW